MVIKLLIILNDPKNSSIDKIVIKIINISILLDIAHMAIKI